MFDPHQRTKFWPIPSRSDDPSIAISDGPRAAGEENQATSMVGPLVREPSGMEIERKSGSKSWDSSQNSLIPPFWKDKVYWSPASHGDLVCFWSTCSTSWSNGVSMGFDMFPWNLSTLTFRSSFVDIGRPWILAFSSQPKAVLGAPPAGLCGCREWGMEGMKRLELVTSWFKWKLPFHFLTNQIARFAISSSSQTVCRSVDQ